MFADRAAAGVHLAAELRRALGAEPPVDLVLGLARGGVPVAAEVAHALGLPLGVMVVRKIGAPGAPELAIGAVAEDGTVEIDQAMVRDLDIDLAWMRGAAAREAEEAQRRVVAYRHGEPMPSLANRTVLLVDDGLATGITMRCAVGTARRAGAARVIVAVPTGSRDAVRAMHRIADDVVCCEEPLAFGSVGQQYDDFRQVGDLEVTALLAA